MKNKGSDPFSLPKLICHMIQVLNLLSKIDAGRVHKASAVYPELFLLCPRILIHSGAALTQDVVEVQFSLRYAKKVARDLILKG